MSATASPILATLLQLEWSAHQWMRSPFVLDGRWCVTDGKILAWHDASGVPDSTIAKLPVDGIRRAMDATNTSAVVADGTLIGRIATSMVRQMFSRDLRTDDGEPDEFKGEYLVVVGSLALGGIGIHFRYLGRLIAAGASIGPAFENQPGKHAFPFVIDDDGVAISGFVMASTLVDTFKGERVEFAP